jgi:hypothetical protein
MSIILHQSTSTNSAIYGTYLLTRRRMTNGLASSASPRLYSSILANFTTLCIKARVSVSPTAFSTTADWIPILDDATPYPRCTYPEHRSASPVEELQFDEPPLAPSPNPAHTPTPSATIIIPPSRGPSASAVLASNSVASLQSHTSVPSSSQP